MQNYNAAEALPNLLNPFSMLALLGLMQLPAKHIVGFTALVFAVTYSLRCNLTLGSAGALAGASLSCLAEEPGANH